MLRKAGVGMEEGTKGPSVRLEGTRVGLRLHTQVFRGHVWAPRGAGSWRAAPGLVIFQDRACDHSHVSPGIAPPMGRNHRHMARNPLYPEPDGPCPGPRPVGGGRWRRKP